MDTIRLLSNDNNEIDMNVVECRKVRPRKIKCLL